MSEWVTPPVGVLRAAALRLIDADQTLDRNIPRTLAEGLLEYFSEDAVCDHAVNICVCEEEAIAHNLQLLLDGRKVCDTCFEDGFVYDEAAHRQEAERLRRRHGDVFDLSSESLGYISCPTCQGRGTVPL